MLMSMVWGVVRHVFSAGGAGFAVDGIMSGDQWKAIIGGFAALAAVLASIMHKAREA